MTLKRQTRRDHYVSKTYLKHFSKDDSLLFVYHKKSREKHIAYPSTICFEYNGDHCEHYENEYAIRDSLKKVEPLWNPNIEKLKKHDISPALFLDMSYFIAYLRS